MGPMAIRGTLPAMLPSLPTGRRPLRRAASLALATMLLAAGAVAAPAPAAAATTTRSVETALLDATNADRAALGLRPLRLDTRLAAIARDRSTALTGATTFSHAAAGGSLTAPLAAVGVQWWAWGENLAWVSGGLRATTAAALHGGWRRSPTHWANLVSRNLNYVGFGVAVRAADGRVFASAVFTESRDHSAPSARIVSATRSGTTIAFTWRGWDAPLQSHWAGMRDMDVWYRVDDGTWRLLRDNTTATGIRLGSRASGHRHWLMVRARDGAGNVGRASAPVSVWVP